LLLFEFARKDLQQFIVISQFYSWLRKCNGSSHKQSSPK